MAIEMTLAEAEGLMSVGESVRHTSPLLRALELWRMQAREELATNSVYFEALTIMLQLPGSRRYVYACADDVLDDLSESPREVVRDLLGAALDRLGMPELIEQVPRWGRDEPQPLSADLAAALAKRDEIGVMNVVAECLDVLMVRPGVALAEKQPKSVW